jgi:hypothetical protein
MKIVETRHRDFVRKEQMSNRPKYSPGMVCYSNGAYRLISASVQNLAVSAQEPVLILSLERLGDMDQWDYSVLTKSGQVGWLFEDCLTENPGQSSEQ